MCIELNDLKSPYELSCGWLSSILYCWTKHVKEQAQKQFGEPTWLILGKPIIQLVEAEPVRPMSHEPLLYHRHWLVLFTMWIECFHSFSASTYEYFYCTPKEVKSCNTMQVSMWEHRELDRPLSISSTFHFRDNFEGQVD